MLNSVVIFHLSLHLRVSQILYEEIDSLFNTQFTDHNLLLIFKEEKGVWTTLLNELKVSKL